MFRRLLLTLAVIFFMLSLSGEAYGTISWTRTGVPVVSVVRADIVVYGGGLAGCAAAWKAACAAPDKRVVMLVPYPEARYGGLATVGGQNFWDLRYWKRDGSLVQGGSFAEWLAATGPFYSPDALAERIAADLGGLANLETYWATDISAVYKDREGRLQALALQRLERDDNGAVVWAASRAGDVNSGSSVGATASGDAGAGSDGGRANVGAAAVGVFAEGSRGAGGEDAGAVAGGSPNGATLLEAVIFIDASEDGRLSRLAGAGVTVGREDWPAEFQANDYGDGVLWPRQQAASLMFKVRGVKPGRYDDMIFRQENGAWGAYGGLEVYINDEVLRAFNERHGPRGFALKPLNAAQDGPGSSEWWINALLIFNVDGRANARDRGTDAYPADMAPGALDTDTAWLKAREMLANPDFITALRRFQGFEEAQLVRDERGEPVTGAMLYLRETVHTVFEPGPAGPGSDDRNYALTTAAVYGAGEGPADGVDAKYYVNRIGLGFYWQDVNAYHFADLKGPDGLYHWPVTPFLRPDYPLTAPGPDAWPRNPVYLPFEVLLSRSVPNLLIPGYATGMSSLAWASLRVLPNQCVLGDAAGVAAAYAVNTGRLPGEFTSTEVAAVREMLKGFGARVDK